MVEYKDLDVIIIGGSYAGLSAAMALGRSLRKVLVIDNGVPCNIQTPYSHNFITQDGKTPSEITAIARAQVEKYKTVYFFKGLAVSGEKLDYGFSIKTQSNVTFIAKKVIFATGIKDIHPPIKGFSDCWGITLIHCPYCHGYEVRNKKTGILGNGDYGYQFSKMISNWTDNIILFTNGKSTLTEAQTILLKKHNIPIVETIVDELEHHQGKLKNIIFNDGTKTAVHAVYTKSPFVQHSDIPLRLGCTHTEEGFIEVDDFQKTTVSGIFACGDNSGKRAVAFAVSSGGLAGVAANMELIDEEFS